MTEPPSTAAVRSRKGKIQERYGVAKDQARKQIDDEFASQGF